MIFHVLGPLGSHSSTGAVVDFGTRKAGTVLGVLLLHPNARVRTDELVRATWPEHAVPAAAKANRKTYVYRLRCVLPPFGDGSRVGDPLAVTGALRDAVAGRCAEAVAAHQLGVDRRDARALLENLVDHHLVNGSAVVRSGFRLAGFSDTGSAKWPLPRELLGAAPAVTTGPGGGAVLRAAATTHAAITSAAAELSHVGARHGVRLERLVGRHASAVAATLPVEGGSL
ncbi:hypothetical protein V1227_16560 [Lentzea sp. DG1S-22]|uniref:AfsR/SARP family transcriptional regulator n=1 Tax=Lentzea sp. DG1S-22 TaxID=3108822 RepID=UPI002E771E2B|nr:hypothetical protein [Lentzea sp. DG1S-22]WVH84288.1 hypothetical protein V1227_16560 [Lentzea sp. DG1S-22]